MTHFIINLLSVDEVPYNNIMLFQIEENIHCC